MGRGIEQGPAPRVLGVLGAGGEDLSREGPRRRPLAGAARAAEEVGVRRARRPAPRSAPPAPAADARSRLERHRDAAVAVTIGPRSLIGRSATASITRSWTSSTVPSASITTTRSEAIIAISS